MLGIFVLTTNHHATTLQNELLLARSWWIPKGWYISRKAVLSNSDIQLFLFCNLGVYLYTCRKSHTHGRESRIYTFYAGTRQLGPRTTRTETSRPVSEDKSARKRGLVGPYVKTTRTV
jgi:hypothetical protein